MQMLLLAALRGSIILYQGEELGLPQVDVPFDRLQDPEAIANWPRTLGRDGARTPMPRLADLPNLGFSVAEPWFPVGQNHAEFTIERQEADPHSQLQFTRRWLALRRDHPALRIGSMKIVEAGERLLVFERQSHEETLRCSFNLSDSAIDHSLAAPIASSGNVTESVLAPWSGAIEVINR